MRLSRVFVLVGYSLLPIHAQGQVEREAAIEEYNRATRIERDGFENRDGGPGSRYLRACQTDCLISSLNSYEIMPSKLAAWRVVSCAAGTENWVLTYLAVEAFKTLEPAGIEGWSHSSFSEEEVSRVRAAAAEAPRRIGVVVIDVPERGTLTFASRRSPVVLPTGSLPSYEDLDDVRQGPARMGSHFYFPAGTEVVALMRSEPGGPLSTIRQQAQPLEGVPPNTSPPAVPVVPPRSDSNALAPSSTAGPAPIRTALIERPSRTDVAEAFARVTPQVRNCLRGSGSVAIASIVFRGLDGSVEAVRVAGVTNPHQACVERVVRGLRLSPFRRRQFNVTYPFRP